MPLRALHGDRDVVAPLLHDDEWTSLKAIARLGALTLPCCGSPAKLRVSKLGLKHFYHPSASLCAAKGETEAHLLAKLEILRACLEAEYTAQTECSENDWRADILAIQGDSRVAFEVQWSRQTLEEILQRQEAYRRHGVRGCWFVRHPPRELVQYTRDHDLLARHDLPLFLLEQAEQGTFVVYLNARLYPLEEIVVALLQRRISFRAVLTSAPQQQVRIGFFPIVCWRCHRTSHVYALVEPEYGTVCGRSIYLLSTLWSDEKREFASEIRAAVQSYLLTVEGSVIQMGAIKRRYSHTTGCSYLSFGCRYCDALFGDWPLRSEEIAARFGTWAAVLDATVTLRQSVSEAVPHWCYPASGSFCQG